MNNTVGSLQETDQGFAIIGNVQFENAVALQEQGDAMIKVASQAVTIDLANMTASGTVAVAVLLGWFRVAQQHEVELNYINITQESFEMARVCGVELLLPIQNCLV